MGIVTIEDIIKSFESHPFNVNKRIVFKPEVKIKREKDTIYISEMKKLKHGYIAFVEVYNPKSGTDKAPMTISSLDQRSLLGLSLALK